jgi:hypothetical protein
MYSVVTALIVSAPIRQARTSRVVAPDLGLAATPSTWTVTAALDVLLDG